MITKELKLNEYEVKLSGTLPISGALAVETLYAAGIEFGVQDSVIHPNGDGTYDIIFKGKITKVQVETEVGMIRTKEERSQSQQLRRAILREWTENRGMDKDAWYNYVMGAIRHYLPEVINMVSEEDRKDESIH